MSHRTDRTTRFEPLASGLRVQHLGEGDPRRLHVEASPASVPMEAPRGDDASTCFLPRPAWWPLDDDQWRVLAAPHALPAEEAITVLDLDPALREECWSECLPWRAETPEQATRRSERTRRFTGRLLASIRRDHGVDIRSAGVGHAVITPPDRPSTAYDPARRRMLGLHIDDHESLPLDQRRRGFQLLCVNFGHAERYLSFVNLEVSGLLRHLGAAADAESATRYARVWRLKDDFLSRRDYPVLRLTLQPNQAYVVVTQNLIHDGATNRLGRPDVAFLVGGFFSWPGAGAGAAA